MQQPQSFHAGPRFLWQVLLVLACSVWRPASCHVYVRDPHSGLGLGRVMRRWALIAEVAQRANHTVSFVNCHDEGALPWLWHKGPAQAVPLSRTCHSDIANIANDYERISKWQGRNERVPEDTKQVHGGADWCQAIKTLKPGEDVVLEHPGEADLPDCLDPKQLSATSAQDAECKLIHKWFDKPSGLVAKHAARFEWSIHDEFAFHIRGFDESDGMLEYDQDLKVTAHCKQRNDCDDRVRANEDSFHNLMHFLNNASVVAYEAFLRTGKLTFLSVDSHMIKKYVHKKRFRFTTFTPKGTVASSGHGPCVGPSPCQPSVLYGSTTILDFHGLSVPKKVYAYPVESSFAKNAACRGGGQYTVCNQSKTCFWLDTAKNQLRLTE